MKIKVCNKCSKELSDLEKDLNSLTCFSCLDKIAEDEREYDISKSGDLSDLYFE